jgi:hypothetical protein
MRFNMYTTLLALLNFLPPFRTSEVVRKAGEKMQQKDGENCILTNVIICAVHIIVLR